jgi:hypothetical protein
LCEYLALEYRLGICRLKVPPGSTFTPVGAYRFAELLYMAERLERANTWTWVAVLEVWLKAPVLAAPTRRYTVRLASCA